MFDFDISIADFDADVADDANVDADGDVVPRLDLLQTFGPLSGTLFKFLLILSSQSKSGT